MSRIDRDAVLARTDLRALADEVLGPRRGRGATAMWACPTHEPQTGRTPPVSIFETRRGEQRWHCHGCGDGGTAIDLLIATTGTDVRGALETLAERTALDAPPRRARPPAAPAPMAPSPHVGQHVRRCADRLWTTDGRRVLEWLRARGFDDQTLHEHAVGADPGPRRLARAAGIPRRGVAAIFPVYADGETVYFQARYLDPDAAGGRKYDNPDARLVPNPRLAWFTPSAANGQDTLFVCEGIPDALSVTQAGQRAVAVLGVGLASARISRELHGREPTTPLRVMFDDDHRGVDATERLLDELEHLGHPDANAVALPHGVHDANHWLQVDPAGMHATLAAAAIRTEGHVAAPTLEVTTTM